MPIILGIESTCDETGAGIVSGGKILANSIASSAEQHARWGGVIPEIASRAHLEALQPTLDRALDAAKITLKEIDAIAVSAGPGLAGCLAVGASFAKGLALSLGIPIYGVNHVTAHITAARLAFPNFPQKYLGLIVSGGHTSIALKTEDGFKLIGSTTDDAAGECFDKIGRLLGFLYPAGKTIETHAKLGDPSIIAFPKAYTQKKHQQDHRYDFSFSGLKTAAARFIESNQEALNSPDKSVSDVFINDTCAALAKAVSEVLVEKTLAAANEFGIDSICIGGGFAANFQLRDLLTRRASAAGISTYIPPLDLCTDNGAMIAALGETLYLNSAPSSPLDFETDSAMNLNTALQSKPS